MRYRLRLAKDADLLAISSGEVITARTLQYKGRKIPYIGGLFCQKIFGPINSYSCACGKLSGVIYRGQTCSYCEVPLLSKVVRSKRFGHIRLELPYINPFSKKFISHLLDISIKDLDKILSCKRFFKPIPDTKGKLVIDGVRHSLDIVSQPARIYSTKFIENRCEVIQQNLDEYPGYVTSSLGLESLLQKIDLTQQPHNKYLPNLLKYGYSASDLVSRILLVTPPNTRPLLENAASISLYSTNDFYSRILRISTRLRMYKRQGIPLHVLYKEAAMQQLLITRLLETGGYSSNIVTNSLRHSLISGASSIFRKYLLGKRVDFSGRAVITVGPNLSLDEVGLPEDIGMELFKPFIYNQIKTARGMNHAQARQEYITRSPIAQTALREISSQRKIVLNRQPTLHKYGIYGLTPVIHTGKDIKLHPLLCKGLGADFDGDTVSVYATLSDVATHEAKTIMSPVRGLLSSATGEAVLHPSHEMVLGLYCMTQCVKNPARKIIESSLDRLLCRHTYPKDLPEHLPINEEILFRHQGTSITTSVGRLQLENLLEMPYGYIQQALTRKTLCEYIEEFPKRHSVEKITQILDTLKAWGNHYATQNSISLGMDDFVKLPNKDEEFTQIKRHTMNYREKLGEHQYIKMWLDAVQRLQDSFFLQAGSDNPLAIFYVSGARGTLSQISQLGITKGIVINKDNTFSKTPIKNSYFEGLSIEDYWTTIPKARRAFMEMHFYTPRIGYLERKLVQICRDLFIGELDCGTTQGILVPPEAAVGRYTLSGHAVSHLPPSLSYIRSPVTCESSKGICAKCYGIDLSTQELVENKTAVGILAAQSVSEPIYQAMLKNKHTASDPTLSDLDLIVTSQVTGQVTIVKNEFSIELRIAGYIYMIHLTGCEVSVKNGEHVNAGDILARYIPDTLTSYSEIYRVPKILRYYSVLRPEGDIAAVATTSGKISLEPVEGGIQINLNKVKLAVIAKQPVLVADGQWVEVGTVLSSGMVNLKQLFLRTDLATTASVFVSVLRPLYTDKINSKHFEMIFRGLTDLVDTPEGLALRSQGAVGKPILYGLIEALRLSPSWLKSMAFGYGNSRLEKAVHQFECSLALPSENLMQGNPHV